jgi:hypothetical protein
VNEDEDEDEEGGDEYLRPAKGQRPSESAQEHSLKRPRSSERSSLRNLSPSECNGESAGTYIATNRYQNKRPGRRRCLRRSTQPRRFDSDETTSDLISDVEPDRLELPIQGSLGIRSQTVYTLNFRPDPPPQRASSVARSPQARKTGPTLRLQSKGSKFTPEEDKLLVELKGAQGLP